jgi:RimJ/RimL family protein N-acetyltransferase
MKAFNATTELSLRTRQMSLGALLALVWRGVKNRLWYTRELRVYCFTAERIAVLPQPTLLRRDCFADLAFYERTEAEQLPPDEYRAVARTRMARGEHLYTLVEADKLLHYGWLIERQTRGEDAALGQVFFPPPDSAVLTDYFTHPAARGRGLYYQSLCQVLHDARTLAHARQAYIYVFGHNRPSRHVIEKVGFEYVGSLCKERRLFVTRRYGVAAGHAEFQTGLL